jgi:hypothetical protein
VEGGDSGSSTIQRAPDVLSQSINANAATAKIRKKKSALACPGCSRNNPESIVWTICQQNDGLPRGRRFTGESMIREAK